MVKRTAALLAFGVLCLPGCSKTPPNLSGAAGLKIKDGVYCTYGWSNNRLAYVIYFTPSSATPFNPDGLAAEVKAQPKEGDQFSGGLDGSGAKGKFPFKCDAKKGEVTIDNKPYRTANGAAFLVTLGNVVKVQQVQVPFVGGPKNTEETPEAMDAAVKKFVTDTPKIKEFPAPEPKPPTKKK